MRAWLDSIVGEYVSLFVIKIVALTTYGVGTAVGGFWVFAQAAATDQSIPSALGTFLASAGPAGALVGFLIWHIDKTNKRDDAKEERHLNNVKLVTETFTGEVRAMRTESGQREERMHAALTENTKALVVFSAKCALPHVEQKIG